MNLEIEETIHGLFYPEAHLVESEVIGEGKIKVNGWWGEIQIRDGYLEGGFLKKGIPERDVNSILGDLEDFSGMRTILNPKEDGSEIFLEPSLMVESVGY